MNNAVACGEYVTSHPVTVHIVCSTARTVLSSEWPDRFACWAASPALSRCIQLEGLLNGQPYKGERQLYTHQCRLAISSVMFIILFVLHTFINLNS